MGITIAPLRAEDHAEWSELWAGYLAFYETELDGAITQATFDRLIAGAGMFGAIARDDDGRAVGIVHWLTHLATWTEGTYCYLEDLFVAREHRGGEPGRALFDAVYAAARERGASKVYWHTQAYNGAARSLYDTVGQLTSFVVYEREPL